MKRIGIVGGLSPESTMLYYKTIVEEYRRRRGVDDYPVIIIYSLSFGRFVDLMRAKRSSKALAMLLEAVEALARAGADFALIAANTPHMFIHELQEAAPLPLISIVDALAERLKEDGVSRVGLLGTKTTLTRGFYASMLLEHGIEALIPEADEIEGINRIILEELARGLVKPSSRDIILAAARRLIERGAQAVALACTELPLILRGDEGIPLYDTARIHAMKALEEALE